MPLVLGAQGLVPSFRGQPTTSFSLAAGESFVIPAGLWGVVTDPYSSVQEFDPVSGIWKGVGSDNGTTYRQVQSDGNNFRVANQTGQVVGALLTSAGTGYVTAPLVTDNGTTSATYQAIVGGAVSTAVTVTNGGKNYTWAPIVQLQTPGSPGVQATATCTISAGAVNTVTIVNQGAGYSSAPVVTFINDPRDSTGSGAAASTVLTGAGTITAVVVTAGGSVNTSVPTLTFSGTSTSGAAATAVCCLTTTAYTVTSAGSGYVGNVEVSSMGSGFPTTAAAYTNPSTQAGLVKYRRASYAGALATTGLTATGQSLFDGGIFAGVPTGIVTGFATVSAAQATFAVGGATSTVTLIAA